MSLLREIPGKVFGMAMVVCLWSCQTPTGEQFNLPEQVSFNFHIRPVLSNNCFVCHGPDSSSREAGLRLDIRENAVATLASGNRAIVPGYWRKSEIIDRISSQDHDFMMPPPQANKSLSSREIALIKKWIDQGANWEPYWAFNPIQEPTIPQVEEEVLINNEIDNFIINKLEHNNIDPSDITNSSSLIRRLSFSLTGLPPTDELIDDFNTDPSPENYEKIVDQLLDSPRFGEHWARHWMDLVRYADTRGHEFDYEIIGSWRYRDYLIRAFNDDVPYNQLILEQLAGDLLEEPRLNDDEGFNESVMGTAFFCLTEGKHSPVDLQEDEAERIDNIIDVTTKTFQALTVGCAKCHDHKFDNIPTTDYYSLYGMIRSTRFNLTPAGLTTAKLEILDSIKQDAEEIRSFIGNRVNVKGEVESSDPESVNQEHYTMIGDFREGGLGSWYASGIAFGNALGRPKIRGDRLVGLQSGKASSRVYGKGLQGALRSPDFKITRDSIKVRAAGDQSEVRIIINNFQLIQDPIYGRLRIHPQSHEMRDYAIDVSMWKGLTAYIELQPGNYGQKEGKGFHSYNIEPDAWLEVAYVYAYDQPLKMDKVKPSSEDLSISIQHWEQGTASAAEVAALDKYFGRVRPRLPGLGNRSKGLQHLSRSLYDSVYMVGVTEGEPITTGVFYRGNFKRPGDYNVPHRFFTALSDTNEVFDHSTPSRLAFAQKIAHPQNPLTSRVMVNRLWHHLFGRGLVETVDNFGLQGKPPTHPQLLDHLAIKFLDEGWSVKKMIRYMVMSQTFQRSSQPPGQALTLDPDNSLWHHYPVRRLPAESIRDAILFTSGRLDTAMYGPPVPIYLTEFLKGRGRPAQTGPLDGAGRRSVYQRLMRNFLPPMMLAFDMPVPFSTFGKRNSSNVPAQSLTLLNDPFVIEQARFWARNLIQESDSFNDRIHKIYVKAFSRSPSSEELRQARDFFEVQSQLYNPGEKDELKWWQDYCHAVFNMKEFIFLI